MANVNVLTKLSLSTVGTAVIALGAAGTVQAATFTEVGDAGQTLNTAQNLPGGINVIQGTISSSDDADLFSFSWGGGLFNATTVGGTPFTFDTILQLFDSSGTLIAQNENDSELTLQSTLNLFADSGEYLLGISSFANYAESGPTYGSVSPGFSSDSYSISLNQETASVPEPASLIGILGLGAFGITSVRKRKQQAAVKA
ncbi:DVUA0089 family protein [Nostoc sp. LPT]|uniref:DVUA0089 family protein n=1 Tax=Nostoc sp. LPT TaxID=2815387 RepID=UPI001D6AC333|nr:DVUA0089 family protein [Nostoc sp. LPT]MBN4000548.1 PEP-CTERM sorting domain-containing protein [Nostoc sp. LPT]